MATIKFRGSYIQQTIRKADYNCDIDEAAFLLWLDEEQGLEYSTIEELLSSGEDLQYWLQAYAYSEVLPVDEVVEGVDDPEWEMLDIP